MLLYATLLKRESGTFVAAACNLATVVAAVCIGQSARMQNRLL